MSTKSMPALIADPDLEFLKVLSQDAARSGAAPITVQDSTTLAGKLSDPGLVFSGIFVNPKLAEPYGMPLIRTVMQHRPVTPLFYILDDQTVPMTEEELKSLPIRRAFTKPFRFADLLAVVAEVQATFDSRGALSEAAKNTDPIGTVRQLGDEEFVPIVAENFLAGSSSLFDVYVRAGAGKFLKILKAGDAFTEEKVAAFLEKGVTHFHLLKGAQEYYLNYCDHLTAALLKKPQVPKEVKISQTLNHGEETMSFLRSTGVTPGALVHAEKFTGHVRTVTQQLQSDKHPVIDEFLMNLANYEHAVSATMVAALFVAPLRFQAEKSVTIVGLASFLHDVGLQNMPAKFLDEDESKLTAEEQKLYRTHPIVGAEVLAGVKDVSPTVVQAVLQHHERRTRHGFPNRPMTGTINVVAEIVGIAEEFVMLIRKAKTNPRVNPVRDMIWTGIFKGFSPNIVEAFRKVFRMDA